ncbi:S-layer homology domain-containing protein [Sporosarcina sp. FSL W8-0480]|uniref:S-layer homology domain-containing protein n=1 Tax=Sporosarcina sp. FSL W8-0480 TaxID=2954701 RepID=UPI0030DAA391
MKTIKILTLSLVLLLTAIPMPAIVHADTILPLETTVTGSNSEQSPEKRYTLTVPEAGKLTVSAKSYYPMARLRLLDENNQMMGYYMDLYNSLPENPSSLTEELNVEAGVYTLTVGARTEDYGKHEVRVDFTPAANNEIEPNQTFAEAMPIQVNGARIRGFLSYNDRVDTYKVELNEPGRLIMEIESAWGDFDLFDSEGQSLPKNTIQSDKKAYADLEAGVYYIQKKDYYAHGVYEMSVSFFPANNEEIEPNNSRASANLITLNDNKTHIGFLSITDKVDYYKIEMKYNGILTIDYASEFSDYTLMQENVHYASYYNDSKTFGKTAKSSQTVELKKGTYYFIPSAQVTRLTGVYTMSLRAQPAFKDMSGIYTPAVTYLADKEVTNGLSTTEFGVKDRIKRVDAAIWLAKILNLDTSDVHQSSYIDVPKRAWGAVNALKRENIVNGKSATHFGANDTMTRGEMALLIQRAYELSGDGVKLPFADVSSRYAEAVKALMKNNITQGKSADKFGTDAAITRGEMALFLYRADSK